MGTIICLLGISIAVRQLLLQVGHVQQYWESLFFSEKRNFRTLVHILVL
jgi:hypothetical protein